MAFTRLLKIPIFLFTVALGLVIYQASKSSFLQSIASSPEEQSVPSYFGSWKTWFHPSQSKATGSKQSLVKGWNVLHHLGGNGPWIENAGEGAASNLAPPDGCSVDQVHLVCLVTTPYNIYMIMLIRSSYLAMENDTQRLLPGVVGQSIG
jgi:acid phosphatase